MVYISTDYVFDGQGTRPWEPDDPVVKPLNVYGQAKYEGEVAVEKYAPQNYIVRIAWVFGLNGKEFYQDHAESWKTHDTLTVVDDQIGTPTILMILQTSGGYAGKRRVWKISYDNK